MKERILLVIVVILAILVPVIAVNSDLYYHPYQTDSPTYSVVHESTEGFDTIVEQTGLALATSVDSDDLSTDPRHVFTEAEQQSPEMKHDTNGWQIVRVTVCQDSLVTCDEFANEPEFPTHGTWYPDSGSSFTYAVVEQDGEQYIVETEYSHISNYLLYFSHISMIFSLMIYLGLLARGIYKYRRGMDSVMSGLTLYSVILVLWPYFVMFAGMDSYSWIALPLTGVGILAILRLERHGSW